jgi:hypothetical protein
MVGCFIDSDSLSRKDCDYRTVIAIINVFAPGFDCSSCGRLQYRPHNTANKRVHLMIQGSTELVAIVGSPIAQVKSPENFNRWFADHQQNVAMLAIDLHRPPCRTSSRPCAAGKTCAVAW